MGNFRGFGGGGGGMNMQQLMKQAQKMQEDMARAQEELAETKIVGSAGGGMVEVTMTGTKEVVAVHIKPEAVDPNDVEMLEDLILAAMNEAVTKVEELSKEKLGPMANMTGGLL